MNSSGMNWRQYARTKGGAMKEFKMAEKVISDLKWIAEMDDIDHDICDTASEAISVIKILQGQIIDKNNSIGRILKGERR